MGNTVAATPAGWESAGPTEAQYRIEWDDANSGQYNGTLAWFTRARGFPNDLATIDRLAVGASFTLDNATVRECLT